MVSKEIKYYFWISISLFTTYLLLLCFNYNSISEIIPIHYNLSGIVDSKGSKVNLIYSTIINFIALIGIGYLLKNPQMINYPCQVNDSNRAKVYKNMQYFLCFLSIIITIIFSSLILNLFFSSSNIIFLVISITVIPFFTIYYLNNKS